MRPYRELVVWQKAHDLARDIWELTGRYPSDERFVLVPQMRRSARSIPGNISEGSGRRTFKAFQHYPDIACGSSSELEYDLLLSRDLGHIGADVHRALDARVSEIRRMMFALAGW